jgi:hypothetical protein
MSVPTFSRADRARLTAALHDPRCQICCLCHGEAVAAGVFFPATPAVWGAPPGKTRVFLYGLCRTCYQMPGKEDAVEAKLQASLGSRRN